MAAAIISALFGAINATAALAVLVWFAMPGITWARRRSLLDSADSASVAFAAGIAASLVAVGLVGVALHFFHWAWVFAVPPLLSMAALATPKDDHPETVRHFPVDNSPWTTAAMVAGLVLAWPALAHIGEVTDLGVNFRPFFNADFFKHTGIAQAFLLGDFPPRDLFGHGGPVHYYWLQHLLPASLLGVLPITADPFRVLGAIGGWQTVLLGLLLFFWARRFLPKGWAAFLLVLAATASLSLDGIATWLATGSWLRGAQTLNMEPEDLTTVLFLADNSVMASTLFRLNTYIPQHQLCAIFFVAWCLGLPSGHSLDKGRLDRAALVAAMPATSLLMGIPAVGIVVLLAAASWLALRRTPWVDLGGAALGLLVPFVASMVSLDSSATRLSMTAFEWADESLLSRLLWLPIQLVTSAGFILPLALVGVYALRRNRSLGELSNLAPTVTLALVVLGYATAYTVLQPSLLRFNLELKLSFLLGLAVVPLAAAALSSNWLQTRKAWSMALAGLFILGLPSPAHDAIWHSCETDVCRTDPMQSTTIPTSDWEALQWIRANTPNTALFQQSPQAPFLFGGRDVWIPVVAGRALYASRRGSQTDKHDIAHASELFDLNRAMPASETAGRMKIDYLYLSRALEQDKYDALNEAFSSDPGLGLVFSNGGASLWQVKNSR